MLERELESFLAEILPEAERPDSARSTAQGRVRISFTADARLRTQLERAIGLMRHKFPAGAYESVIGHALARLLDDFSFELDDTPTRRGRPSRESRQIPQRIKAAVWN